MTRPPRIDSQPRRYRRWNRRVKCLTEDEWMLLAGAIKSKWDQFQDLSFEEIASVLLMEEMIAEKLVDSDTVAEAYYLAEQI